ncbi:hypothetical protein HID58_044394 [Brassica napus]|uniref:Myb/SANT-like domain-containing protein n=1 Tax=Brassica napus TaxID=3708 RepID=A0ABQ8BJ81_BRANA|nr:hypothetical protein HID58_044394 [Brassica napus]
MKGKAAWEPEYHRVFVELCVEQKLRGNKPGTQHLFEPFQERTGARFNKKQLKNHWDTMCKQWKIWRRLVQCSDMKWDPEANTFRSNVGDDEGGSSKCKRKRRSRHHHHHEQEIASNFSTHHDMKIESDFSTTHSKGYWSPATHELFLDLLVQETYKGNRPNTHYPKESWRLMLETINQNTGKKYTRSQLKNHWDCLEDMENPRATQFRRKQVPCADKLAIIFKGVIEPGKADFRPYRKKLRDHSERLGFAESRLQDVEIGTPVFNSLEAKRMRESPLASAKQCEYTIGECIERLDSMEEVEPGSDLYMFALDLFLRKEYREIFLQLKKASLRISWLLRLQAGPPPTHAA